MKISVLIPYKPDHGKRDLLWKHVKNRYQRLMPQLELCIGRDDSKSFCRSKAINKAAEKAKGDLFIIVDSDVIFNPKLIDKIILQIDKHPWIIPFKNGYRLNKKVTKRLIKKGLTKPIQVKAKDIERNEGGLGALMTVMTRSCFKAVAGFDERFKGWGYEDKAFFDSLETICGPHYRIDEDIFHLWHPPATKAKTKLHKNKVLYLKYQAATNNVAKMKRLLKKHYK